jgi:uncharacterized protein YbaA (DUF1428 family)
MSYVDAFVAAVPTDKREQYLKHCEIACAIFKENGALSIAECWGEDVPEGKVTSFPMAVKRKEGETVVFGWIVWPDKATRNAGMEKMMQDPRMKPDVNPMPFDGQRMIYGGFDLLMQV